MPSPRETEPRPDAARGVFFLLVSTGAYGTMPIIAKYAYRYGVETGALLFWRFFVAAALFALLSRGKGPALALRQRVILWGLGVVFVGNALTYFVALETVPATTVSLVVYTYPVIVMLESALFGLEHLTVRGVVSAVLAFSGCALTAGAAIAHGPGVYFALACAVIYATYIVLSSRFARGVPAETAAMHLAQAAAVGLAFFASARGGLALPPEPVAWILVLAIALLCTVVAMYAFLAGLVRVGPGRAAVLSSLEVVVTLALAFLFLGERLGPRQWAGAVLILGAVLLQNTGRRFSLDRRRDPEL
jgi:drug/metabolite transporter (DMT)-like permease